MNKIGIGTVQFGLKYGVANKFGKINFPVAKKIIKLAEKNKLDVIDTAMTYGKSENILGKIGVSKFKLITKLPDIPKKCNNVENWIEKKVKISLNNLKVDSLYCLLIHNTKNLVNHNGPNIIKTLYKLKKQKIINKIGVSIYDPSELDKVTNCLKIDIVQAPLSIVDRRLETSGWLKKLHQNKIDIHIRSSFLQGLLLLPKKRIPLKFNRWSKLWSKWDFELKKNNLDAVSACLSYPLSLPSVKKIIVGVDSLEQFKEILTFTKINKKKFDFSFMKSSDLDLINPFNWKNL